MRQNHRLPVGGSMVQSVFFSVHVLKESGQDTELQIDNNVFNGV